MKRSVLAMGKRNDSESKQCVIEIGKWLKKNSIHCIDVTAGEGQITPPELRGVIAGITFGGDGTFLSFVNRLSKKDQFPLMGVNLGTLGFITIMGKTQVKEVLTRVISGEFQEERRLLGGLKIDRNKREVHSGVFLNDAAILKNADAPLLKFEVRLDGALLSRVRADGFLISSSTGSTAYALSAGGPLVHPGTDAMILLPICAHSLSMRPIIVPTRTQVEILLVEADDGAVLVFDGQRRFLLRKGDTLSTRPSQVSLRMVGSTSNQWTEALRSKLRLS